MCTDKIMHEGRRRSWLAVPMMIAALLEHHQMRATGMGIFWEFGLVLFYTVAAVFVGVLLGSSVQKTYGVPGMAPRKKETASHGGSCSGSGSSGSSSSKSMNDGINSYNKARVKGAVYKEVSEQSVDKYISEHEPSSSGSKGKAARSSSSSSPTGGAPRHVAVIMDGNRRFGQEYHNDPLKGHWSGGETLGKFCEWCLEAGVEVLTVYAFSTENWRRTPAEISTLMAIFAKYAYQLQKEAAAKNVRVKVLSTDPGKLPDDVRKATALLEESTASCDGFLLNICLSYGSRDEIVQACKAVARDFKEDKFLNSGKAAAGIEELDEETFSSYLTTSSIPDPDILIRTSGEHRISNFLLYQMAYTELFFVDKYWPEVTREDLSAIFACFAERSRRYGK